MESNPLASLVVCVSLCATAVATPASGARPGATVEQDARRAPGEVFRGCDVCPEMVVMPGGELALGRYEVTTAEYRAFASATGNGGDDCLLVDSWRNPGWPQGGPASGRVRELARRAGVRVVAEREDGRGVSVAERGGMGTGGGGVPGWMPPRAHGQLRTVPGGLLRLEPGRSVGHGRERMGMDLGLLGGRLRPPCVSRRRLGRRRPEPAARPAPRTRRRHPIPFHRLSRCEDARLTIGGRT